MTKQRSFNPPAAGAPPEPGIASLCAWIYLALIALMPWLLATQTPPALLHRWALMFEPLLGLDQLVATGTPHGFEECVDLGVVFISAIAGALILGVRRVRRKRMGDVHVDRKFHFGERLIPVFFTLLLTFPWLAPVATLHDYSGVKTGAITRLIDTSLLARGIFCATWLIASIFSLLCVAFITFGSRKQQGEVS